MASRKLVRDLLVSRGRLISPLTCQYYHQGMSSGIMLVAANQRRSDHSFGIFNEFSNKIKREAERNRDFKESLKQLKEKAEELKGVKEEIKVRAYGIPRVVFHGLGAATSKPAHMHVACGRMDVNSEGFDDQTVDLSSLKITFPVKTREVPDLERYKDPSDRFLRVLAEIGVIDANRDGIIVNKLRGDRVRVCVPPQVVFCINERARIWCVGPASLYNHTLPVPFASPYMKWLDERLGDDTKVMYVSFGTQVRISDLQMNEIARGLEGSGHYFLWATRPKDGKSEETVVISGGRGLVVRGWVDQQQGLSHPAVKGFMSHCGWNSVLESICILSGVPVLTWALGGNQPMNAKLVREGLDAGLAIPMGKAERDGFVPREAIREGVKELMGGEKGKATKVRAKEIGQAAREAVDDAGSSSKSLDEFVEFASARNDQSMKFPRIN